LTVQFLFLASDYGSRGIRMRVEAVLFDLFDTLVLIDSGNDSEDVYYGPCLKRMHEFIVKNGIEVSFEDLKRVYFQVRDRLYSETQKTLEEPHFNVRVSRILQELGYKFDVSNPVVTGATNAFAEEFMRYVHLDKNALDVLRKLHGRYKLGIVSNFGIPESVWKLLDKFGLKKFFDVILISGEVNRRKPSQEIFDMALKALDVPASEALFVGDTPSLDVKGPQNAGIRAILIERKPIETTSDAKPDAVIRSLKELPELLEDF